ncbi:MULTISPECIES: hypothetical protein [Pontibacillus]|uniref:DUF4305 domain-containing protein n=1 Tax=Pontibacillus chungwhensis TaxID=265426 RepID=A0ABY8V078_9BACI|nr:MULTISPECIES: hypothetical protein [Pontibacillus]MCD5324354.1 hypothetical protein [Pontibacillus sp. HN14]WIF99347.1 hypothetical protein QNI29_06735 [Pontibacillus chungwhensis]
MKNLSATQLYLAFFVTVLSFLQAYTYWGDQVALAYFFLIAGVVLLALDFIAIYKKKTSDKR